MYDQASLTFFSSCCSTVSLPVFFYRALLDIPSIFYIGLCGYSIQSVCIYDPLQVFVDKKVQPA